MKEKGETNLPSGPPATDPRVIAYQRAADARAATRQQQQKPLPIPRLDAPAQEGRTMAQHAEAESRRRAALEATPVASTTFTPAAGQPSIFHQAKEAATQALPELRIEQGDTLPPEAMAEVQANPALQGMGAMLAVNQPVLAAKYGVLRRGRHVSPNELRGIPDEKVGILRRTTVDALDALAAAQNGNGAPVATATTAVTTDTDKQAVETSGVGATSARYAESEEVKHADARGASRILDDFDFDQLRQAITRDMLNSEEQKKIIEARLTKIDLSVLISNGSITQVVPIIPGVFEPTYQTTSGDETLAIKRLITAEAKNLASADDYYLDKHSIMGIALGLYAINKKVMPNHRDAMGNFDDEAFLRKFNTVVRLPTHMLSSIALNHFWFEHRVRGMFKAEAIKNG